MAASSTPEDGDPGFQIAPMVDVVFVLLLFFMAVAGSQTLSKELTVNLPSGGPTDKELRPMPIVIDITAHGQVRLNDQPMDSTSDRDLPQLSAWFQETIRKFGDKDPVIIRPDPQARQERIIDVLNSAARSGVKHLTFG